MAELDADASQKLMPGHVTLQVTCLQIRGANTMGIPVIVTEQYPKALGHTVSELRECLAANTPVVSKTLFSMVVPEVEEFLARQSAIKQVSLQAACC